MSRNGRWLMASSSDDRGSHAVPPHLQPELTTRGSFLTFYCGCNTINATFELRGTTMTMVSSYSTMMGCDTDQSALETRFDSLIREPFECVITIDALTLTGPAVSMTFRWLGPTEQPISEEE
jgi:heat shock protein HslJ